MYIIQCSDLGHYYAITCNTATNCKPPSRTFHKHPGHIIIIVIVAMVIIIITMFIISSSISTSMLVDTRTFLVQASIFTWFRPVARCAAVLPGSVACGWWPSQRHQNKELGGLYGLAPWWALDRSQLKTWAALDVTHHLDVVCCTSTWTSPTVPSRSMRVRWPCIHLEFMYTPSNMLYKNMFFDVSLCEFLLQSVNQNHGSEHDAPIMRQRMVHRLGHQFPNEIKR